MFRRGIAFPALAAGVAVAGCVSGCGAKSRPVTGGRASVLVLSPLRAGDRFAYAVRQGVGPIERGAAQYVEVTVAPGAGGKELLLSYRRTRVSRPARRRTERALHLPPREQTVDVKTATYRVSQGANGTLRWVGPGADTEPLQLRLVEACIAPELRSPMAVGQTYDSGQIVLPGVRSDQTPLTGRVRYVVRTVERVRVPAGVFDAHRVEFELFSDAAGASRRWTDWYTADRHLVKREIRTDSVKILGRSTDYHESLERIEAVPAFEEYRSY